MKKFFALTILSLIVLMLVGACGPTPAPTAAPTKAPVPPTETPTAAPAPPTAAPTATPAPAGPSGKVVIAIGGDPSTLDPQYADDGNERAVNDNIYEMLLFRDPKTMEIGPGLAESWKQVDPTTWEFKLRQGVKFHNGEPFNAEAVVFSVKRIIDPAFKSEQLSFVATLTDARAVDEYTVQLMTSGPDPIPVSYTHLTLPTIYSV